MYKVQMYEWNVVQVPYSNYLFLFGENTTFKKIPLPELASTSLPPIPPPPQKYPGKVEMQAIRSQFASPDLH